MKTELLPNPEQTAFLATPSTLTTVHEVAASAQFPAFCVFESRTSRGGNLSVHIPHPFWVRVEQFLPPHPAAHLLCLDVLGYVTPSLNSPDLPRLTLTSIERPEGKDTVRL